MKSPPATAILFTFFLLSCPQNSSDSSMKKESFGTLPDGSPVSIYILRNKNGLEARITNYGGILVSLRVPDRNGKLDDIVLGYDSLSQYVAHNNPHFGALIGRYGNRISHGKFTLNGASYTLALNNGENSLHGGIKGFDKALWTVNEQQSTGSSLVLSYTSKDGEEGYPGTLKVTVTYSLSDKNELRIQYGATTDKPTVLNLTHHSYFNLAGAGNGDILNHRMSINAGKFTPVDKGLIPTGELRDVQGTPMDFRTPTSIGARINARDDQLIFAGGYDHNWVLNRDPDSLSLAATVTEASSGRRMEVWTTEPGLQFYSGNFLDGSNVGKGGVKYLRRFGFCLETQHFPDSPNKPQFPSTVLNPGDIYSSTTVYRFLTEK